MSNHALPPEPDLGLIIGGLCLSFALLAACNSRPGAALGLGLLGAAVLAYRRHI